MKAKTDDAIDLLRRLSVAEIRERLYALASEEAALRVLLRAALSRERHEQDAAAQGGVSMSVDLTVAAVTKRYGVSQHVVLSWIGSGQLAALNVARKPNSKRPTWRISEAALAAFEAARANRPHVKPSRRQRKSDDVVQFY